MWNQSVRHSRHPLGHFATIPHLLLAVIHWHDGHMGTKARRVLCARDAPTLPTYVSSLMSHLYTCFMAIILRTGGQVHFSLWPIATDVVRSWYNRVLCKNGWTDRDAVCGIDSCEFKEPCKWCDFISHGSWQFWGGMTSRFSHRLAVQQWCDLLPDYFAHLSLLAASLCNQ